MLVREPHDGARRPGRPHLAEVESGGRQRPEAIRPPSQLRNYVLVTAAYWADTLTDGAIRMLVLLYFHQRGYSAVQVAMLFLFYEVFGIVTNLVGGNQELAGRIDRRIGDRNYGVDFPVRTVLAASQKRSTGLAGSSSTAEVA